MPRCLVSLGSNLGDRGTMLSEAVEALRGFAKSGSLRASTQVASRPLGGPSGQRAFRNAAAVFETDESPRAVLARLLELERSADRRREVRWDARTLDLDLLLYGEEVIRTPELRVPHPRMTFRPFVLEPACEVAADWRHPECGLTLSVLRDRLAMGGTVRLIEPDEGALMAGVLRERPEIPIVTVEADGETVCLTIDARPDPFPLDACGPRLVLADCPREHWREEVLAALECVWPTQPEDTP